MLLNQINKNYEIKKYKVDEKVKDEKMNHVYSKIIDNTQDLSNIYYNGKLEMEKP